MFVTGVVVVVGVVYGSIVVYIVVSWNITFGIQWNSAQFLFYVLILFVVIVNTQNGLPVPARSHVIALFRGNKCLKMHTFSNLVQRKCTHKQIFCCRGPHSKK